MDVNKVLILSVFAIAMNSTAEVYRWVDKNGKVHFTDRKPAAEAENITAEVKSQNIDTSSGELQKLTSMREQEEKAKQEKIQQEQKIQQERKEKLAELNRPACERAKIRLKKISGHIVFTDEQGRAVTVTEKERQQMVADLTQEIQQHCSQ
jgi:hypothetical protein